MEVLLPYSQRLQNRQQASRMMLLLHLVMMQKMRLLIRPEAIQALDLPISRMYLPPKEKTRCPNLAPN